MKCKICGGLTFRSDALSCQRCGAAFDNPLQDSTTAKPLHRILESEESDAAPPRPTGWNPRVVFVSAAAIWYGPLAIGLLGFISNGFHPEGLRFWLLARNGPMLIFTVGEDPATVFVLPVLLELLMLPTLVVAKFLRLVWPLVLVALVTVAWAFAGIAVFAIG